MPSAPSFSSASVDALLPRCRPTPRRSRRRRRAAPRPCDAAGRARRHDDQRHLVARCGRACCPSGSRASESNTTRFGWRVAVGRARRQQRVVGERRADADADGVDLAAPAVHEAAALLAGDPLRVAGLGRDLAVEAHRGLEDDVRAAGARVLAERLVQQARARATRRRRRSRPRRPRRAGCRARGRTPCRVGSSEATTTRLMPALTIASVQGGVRPWWQQGSSVTYIVAPDRVGRARSERRHLGVRRRRRRRGSPRPALRRRARPPRRRAGWGSCARDPARASSIALPGAQFVSVKMLRSTADSTALQRFRDRDGARAAVAGSQRPRHSGAFRAAAPWARAAAHSAAPQAVDDHASGPGARRRAGSSRSSSRS